MIGRVIGNYQIQQKLGEGGMGSVYRAVDLMLDRDVAIKVLRPELLGHADIVERFRSEAVTLAKLHHPNIATLFNLLREEGEMMMVMEFVRGQTLDSLLEQLGVIAPGTAVAWCCQVLEAMQYAHRKGVVHRDIKPANLMITDEGLIKVTDFGIARVLGESRKTRTGHIIGTITYMSPEQIRGQDVDARADLYALGAVLFELLTGQPPFTADNEFAVMNAHINTPAPLARNAGVDVPDWLDAVMQRALAKGTLERFQTATDFRAMLTEGQQAGALPEEPRVAEHVGRHVEKVTASRGQPPPTRLAGTPDSVSSAAGVPPPTRLAGAPPDVAHGAAKETRLAGASPVPGRAAGAAAVRPAPSLLQQVSWRHYAGAAAVLIILGSLGAFLMLRGGSVAGTIVATGPPGQAQPGVAPATAPSVPAATGAGPAGRVGDVGNPPSGTQTPMPAPPIAGTPPDRTADKQRVVDATPGAPSPRSEKRTPAPGAETPRPVPDGPAGAPPTSPEPTKSAESAKPAAEAPAPEARYSDVRWIVTQDDDQEETDVFLELRHDTFTLKPTDEEVTGKTLAYKAIVSLVYEERKPSRFGKLFGGGNSSWLTITTKTDTAVLHLDSKNYKAILAAFEARTGLTVQK